MPVIGFLGGGSREGIKFRMPPFHQGLREAGYVEGQNVAIEYHWAEGHYDRLPALAAQLVRRQVSMIATVSIPAALAAKAATTTIPIVFETGFDPIEAGLVASLNRPGANITGATRFTVALGPKRLELLHELVPQATTIAFLTNPANPKATESARKDLEAAARTLRLKLHVLNASTEDEIDTAFATLVQLRAGALVVNAMTTLQLRNSISKAFAVRQNDPGRLDSLLRRFIGLFRSKFCQKKIRRGMLELREDRQNRSPAPGRSLLEKTWPKRPAGRPLAGPAEGQ